MKLEKLILENFRSYRDRTEITFSDLTALIGKNEHGKSSVLEALEIFFNNKTVKIDRNDACKTNAENSIVKITCEFSDFPSSLTLDTTSETSLERECLLTADGKLKILKEYDCSKSTISPKIYAVANHPIAPEVSDLLALKISDLKKRASDNQIEVADNRSNAELRQAIREHFSPMERQEGLILLNNKEDTKAIWEQIASWMPVYALFQSDRMSSEDDNEVTDPMKIAVEAAVRQASQLLEDFKQEVRRHAIDVANRTIQHLREFDPLIAAELNPDFKSEPKWESFKLTITDDNGVPINKRGSGTRRLLLLSFFKAEAAKRREEGTRKHIIFAVEEPENSQHPNYQKALINTLMSISEEENSQVILTTHVPGLSHSIPVRSIRYVVKEDNLYPSVYSCENEEEATANLERVIETLGVIPDSRVKILLFVEGTNDVAFFENLSEKIHEEDPNILSLKNNPAVAIIPVGGSTLKQWAEQRYLRGINKTEFHIYDRDGQNNPPYLATVEGINARNNGDKAYLTNKRELENYVHINAICATFGIARTQPIENMENVPEYVARTLHEASLSPHTWDQLEQDKLGKKISQAKKRINKEAIQRMNLALLRESDPDDEILGWLEQISGILRQ